MSSGGPESRGESPATLPSPFTAAAAASAAATTAASATTAAASSAAAAEEDDAVGHDVGRVVLLAVLVVRAGLQPPLDVDRPALRQVLGAVLGLVAPHRHPVPFGLLLALARLVLEDVGRRDAQVAERRGSTACTSAPDPRPDFRPG